VERRQPPLGLLGEDLGVSRLAAVLLVAALAGAGARRLLAGPDGAA
jgi:hypothetical protein